MKNKIIFKTLMLKGEAGSTIVSMEKTGHVGTADIYTITFNDGSTTEISLENMSAITSVEKTSSTDTEDIYTITCADGSTQTFSVLNHNADIAAMSDDIDTIDARVDNFINSVVPNTVETLWTGSIGVVGDSATLSKAVSNFDYIDLYLLGSADSKYIRVPATQTAVQIQQQNLSDDASSNFLRLWEMGVSISGTTVSITKLIAWAWDDPNNSNPTVTANAQNGNPITRIDGVKVASDTPAEVTDIRVGADGKTYNSAGAAVRGQISDLNDYLYVGEIHLDYSDLEQGGFSLDDGLFESTLRIRMKDAIRVYAGTKIKFPENGLYYNVRFLNTNDLDTPSEISNYPWDKYTDIVVPYSCYLYIIIANAKVFGDSTDIVPTDFTGNIDIYQSMRNDEEISSLNTRLTNIEQQIKPLYMGDFVRAGFSTNAFTQSTQRLCMKDCVALPYGEKTKIKVTMDKATQGNYYFAVRAGKLPYNLSSNKYWYKSGDIVTFDAHEQYYRVIFANGYPNDAGTAYLYYDIDVSDIEKINPVIEYYKDYDEVDEFTSNADNLEKLLNAKNVLSASSHGGITTYPVIFHASDFHGDYERVKNALSFCEHCDGDAIVFSGDMVANRPLDNADWMHKLFADFSGKPIICTGNHDVDNSSYTDADVYNYYMAPSAAKIGNENGTTYYYTDIASKSLRIIVTDIYQYGATTRSNAHMTSEQLAYICSALKSTPNGYGVLIVTHTPCVDVGNLADQQYNTFFQSLRKYGFTHYDISGAPIYDIIDAFNARTTISKTYTQTGSPASISVSDDFSGVDSSVEFIAHLTGHIHEDSVCYLPTETKQLMLNICCGVAMTGGSGYPYLADDCDITRLPYDKTQDAINVYVIDRANKTVKIVRIGGTLTYDMKKRDYMVIPYAD